ncbi:MAG: carbohydrate ABC transporter permease [Gemmatimonadetes bacterium]|jgi:ABC-type glycerol-3-phosphate transport system permease component|nr:carbohydrate ABC transporter permease [Gemmatimonadota bacterium]MDE0965032.1 carbohydrate ABC transporter permease [Candidatus Latescibacterota bacterium]MBT5324790.1 carbohydrate ABC transporter permease [Gemmatimonadota bacterium]MBT5448762.1 carbohydrate ABC transporter permease [Gemmatimonadota bacterium]MBT5803734.1 carbohydrate ABC transporter permease [Gemmatimonadota bacterium]|tara:strand:+ start:460 stop:1347 length:888 start_codon:yes stop_codon:yes gene_type:complete
MNKGSKLAVVAMIFGAAVMVYPYAFMLGSSFKTRKEFAEDRQSLIPPRFQPGEVLASMRGEESARDWPGADWPLYQNYVDAIRYGQIDRYLANSFIYAVLITSAQLFFNILAAYAFARMHFAGRDLLFALLLSTMMVPPAVLLVPNFLVVRDLGLVDTLWGILLPGFAGAFGVFLLRQAFLNIPAELEQAARIDGCGSWGILWNVILPLSKSALITLGLFTFMGAWNMFEWPLVVLSNQDYYPLTVGLSFFRAETSSDWPRIFAASAMGAAPLIALFLVAQRYLVGGISLSGMKT